MHQVDEDEDADVKPRAVAGAQGASAPWHYGIVA